MDDVAFDGLSRRASLLSLGAAGLAAAFAGAVTTDAKNKAKKKLKKKQQQKCLSQEEQCETSTNVLCVERTGTPEELAQCLGQLLPCCEFLAPCEVTAFFDCLNSA